MTDAEIEKLFRHWWAQNYPSSPGPNTLVIQLGWARYLLDHLQDSGKINQQRVCESLLAQDQPVA
jgi:hypothetical protein